MSECMLSIEKLQEIIYCRNLIEHIFSGCMFGWQCIVDIFSFNTCQSVNGPTPGDLKLQNPIEHAISDRRIIKEVV